MLYRQKFDTFIRIFEDVGYITNKSDYSDRVTNSSGAIFLNALSRKPKGIQEITDEIARSFINVNKSELENDILNFFTILEEDGFIISGMTTEELDCKDKHFSYSYLEPKTIKSDYSSIILRSKKDSQEYLNDYFKDKPYLIQLQLELSNQCNERCVHCYIPHENKLSNIDPELFYDVLEQCSQMGILNLVLSGGEPMMHPKFCEFIREAKNYDFAISILSNLTMLNDEIVAELKENRLSSVQVSLYSMNPKIHDSITQIPGSFSRTRDAILKLIQNDIPLQISCPTMKQNKESYVDVLKWANEHK
jgi:sulfatase maturation enzyme AslB (radical SAM superfamily)